jgi:hypothetical protein
MFVRRIVLRQMQAQLQMSYDLVHAQLHAAPMAKESLQDRPGRQSAGKGVEVSA